MQPEVSIDSLRFSSQLEIIHVRHVYVTIKTSAKLGSKHSTTLYWFWQMAKLQLK